METNFVNFKQKSTNDANYVGVDDALKSLYLTMRAHFATSSKNYNYAGLFFLNVTNSE